MSVSPFRLAALSVALLLISAGLLILPSTAQERPVLPSRHAATPFDALPVTSLGAPDASAVRAIETSPTGPGDPYQYGVIRSVDLRPTRDGTWEPLPSGAWLWRLRVTSPDARSLSVGFTRFDLPPSAALYVHDGSGDLIRGPYTAEDVTRGQHWTPIVQSEALVVELRVSDAERNRVDLHLGRIIHGVRPLVETPGDVTPKSGACNVDVACDAADPWRDQVRSVASYTFPIGSVAASCSGALVNNTAQDGRYLFLTAEHCVSDPENAAGMVFYWNYENPTCRTPGSSDSGVVSDDNPTEQSSSGATLLARYGNVHVNGQIGGRPDLTLVEVDDQIPDTYDLYYAGWNRADQTTSSAVSIHHPAGHAKRIAIDSDPTSITPYPSPSNSVESHLRIGAWNEGTTEGGSSGSPLFDPDGRIVGVLSGGVAGCIADGSRDNDEPDWYGRLAFGYDQGDFGTTTFADVLDPLGTGATAIDGMSMGPPDATAPSAPPLQATPVTKDTVRIVWTAPGDDGDVGRADYYDLRYSIQGPITSESNFETATPVANLPQPGPSGAEQSVLLPVSAGTTYYFAIAAVDNAGNRSSLGVLRDDDGDVVGLTPVDEPQIRAPYPNPFSERAQIEFVLPEETRVRVDVYDALGRRVQRVFDGVVGAQRARTVTIDGSRLASGIYFVRVLGDGVNETVRAAIVR